MENNKNKIKIRELKSRIQELLSKNDRDYKEVIKQRWDFLYKKLDELKELETLERLKNYPKFLNAYLMVKSISRANYQTELLEHTNFWETEDGKEKFLNSISADIEPIEKENLEKKKTPNQEPTSQQLLIMLGERLATNEIKRELSSFGNYLIVENEKGMLKVDLYDGKITPNPAEKFIEKYGLDKKKERI